MPGTPIVIATNGLGTPVTESPNGFGLSVTIATNGIGIPVVFTPSGGLPVVGVANPQSILGADLIAWWDRSRASLTTLSGNQVTSARDVVAGDDLTQVTGASRPLYEASSFNGFPDYTFDGTDDQMTLTGVPARYPIGADPCEIWCIFDNMAPGADTMSRRIFNYGGNTVNTARGCIVVGSGGVQRVQGFVGTGGAAVFLSENAVDASGRHVARVIITATGISLQVDGGAISAESPAVPATANTMVRDGQGTNGAGPFLGRSAHNVITKPLSGQKLAEMWAWANMQRRV